MSKSGEVPPEFESWMRPESGSQPTQRLDAPARPVGSPVGGARRPVGSPLRQPVLGSPQPVQTIPRTIAPPRKKRRRWSAKRIFLTVVTVMAVYAIAVAAVFATSVTKINALPVSDVSSSGTNYLLVGSDSRAGLSKADQKRLHTGSTEGQRTDTIMIMHIPVIGAPTLVSIPRDSWVGIPGYGQGKINAAFANGGPELLITTVEQATGLHIDNYVEIGFAGVADTTDALGGVRLCPTRRYNDANSGLKVKKGCQTMDGQDALAYVRMRYADPRGDLGRVERQQEFIAAVAKKTMSPLTWLLPWRAFGAASAAGSSLTVDKSTGIVDDARLGLAMGMISLGMGTATTVPTVDGTYFVGGQDAVKWDSPKALELFNSID
ncbi:MAG: LCP family protein [Candidatus Nanopelagicales bacterium]